MMTYYPLPDFDFEGNFNAPACMAVLLTTSCFGYFPSSLLYAGLEVVPNNELGGGICQRTGRWYPASRLVRDGTGPVVGDDHALRRGPTWPI
jgi:hypothetical protein